MKKVLDAHYFDRHVCEVAKDLIGTYIVRCANGNEKAYMITEVEAYDGVNDKACHASKGKTSRTEVMFGEPGVLYIYLVYGMHYMLNIVTSEKGYPAAVLIRGVKEISGPGRVTKKLEIGKEFNRKGATPANGLWFEDRDEDIKESTIIKTPRIGVAYAGPVWSKKPYRFVLQGFDPFEKK